MATDSASSDDNHIAPKDFHLSSSSESGSRLSLNGPKCPLCRKLKKNFYCKDCILGGLFFSSKPKATEGYIDKHKALLEVSECRKLIEKKCLKILEDKQKTDVLFSRIRQSKERNKLLKIAVEDIHQRNSFNNEKLMESIKRNEKRQKSLPKYNHKIQELENYVAGRKDKVEKNQSNFEEKQNDIKKLVKSRIQQLFKYIFPISVVKPVVEVESSDDMISALAEASQTTYIRDRWEYMDYSGEMQYCIVAPTLPRSGNYSAYNVWVTQNQDAVPGSNTTLTVEHNPAYSISAALTYTAQLIHVLSFYLNVRLPYKMLYSDFCSNDMTEQQFARRVARLNANVLYLCFSQNVDSCVLRSCETISNILQLIEDESAHLGRLGPIEVDIHQANILEKPLTFDLNSNDASDSEEGDSFPMEWEAVPHCLEVAVGPSNSQSPQMMSTQQASSMTGGIISAAASIASFWRGFTGR